MEKFTASEVRESAIAVAARDMEYEAEMLQAYADLLTAREGARPVQPVASNDKDARFEWALDVGGVLANWCNKAGDALREMMAAYERRIRTLCDAEEIAKEPWRCAEYIHAESVLRDKPTWSVVIPRAQAQPRAAQPNARSGGLSSSQPAFDASKVVETLRAMVSLIHAHDIESLSCDRDGEKYCNCLSGKADDAIKVLAAYDAGQEIQAWNNSVAARDRRNTAQPPAASVPDIDTMVSRFLSWRLPQPWNPDNGISYTRPNYAHEPADHDWPTGTNLFDAGQARAMIEHMLAAQQPDAGDAMEGA